MQGFESILPSDEWQSAGVHWHAFVERRGSGGAVGLADRTALRARVPDAVLRSPWEVARWIDRQTRNRGDRRKVWAGREDGWVEIGDEDDLEHLRRENFGIASRGDSIHADVYFQSERYDMFVEAVNDAQCAHGCTAGTTR